MRCAVDRLSDVGAWHALKQIRVVIEAVYFAWMNGCRPGGGGVPRASVHRPSIACLAVFLCA